MIRPHLLVLGVVAAGVLGGLAIAAVTPTHPAIAQAGKPSGKSVVFADRACFDYGVTPGTSAYDSCVQSAARAFERGEPDVAYMKARAAREARDTCQSNGLAPQTPAHKRCVVTQIERRVSGGTLVGYWLRSL